MESSGGDTPQGAWVGDSISYPSQTVEIIDLGGNDPVPGTLPFTNKGISVNVTITSGDAISNDQLQNRRGLLRLVPPTGAGTLTMSATIALPKPTVRDVDFYISQPSTGRQDVEFPAGNNIVSSFTIAAGETVRIIPNGNKWQLFGRYSAI